MRRATLHCKARTASVASVSAIVCISKACRMRSATIVLLEQRAQRLDVGLPQLAMAGEMRHQRREPAIEQAIEQADALLLQPGVALEHGRVEIASAVLLGADRALGQQAVHERLDGGELPVLLAR